MNARSQILARTKRRYDQYDAPGIGLVGIQSLTESERSRLESVPPVDLKSWLIILALVDPESKLPIFTDSDLDKIREVDAAVTNLLVDRISQHIGMTPADEGALLGN